MAMGSFNLVKIFIVALVLSVWSGSFKAVAAFDALDPTGNLTISWEIKNWTKDGYMAQIKITNFQLYRGAPSWSLGWTWSGREIIWGMVGGKPIEKGDCSLLKVEVQPLSCTKSPIVFHGGYLASWWEDSSAASSAVELHVGNAWKRLRRVKIPKNFTLQAPGTEYSCSPTVVHKKLFTIVSWKVKCVHATKLVEKTPTCGLSISTFHNPRKIFPDCQRQGLYMVSVHSIIQCPVMIHWHVKMNTEFVWTVQITITIHNSARKHMNWNLLFTHPCVHSITKVVGADAKFTGDTLLLYGGGMMGVVKADIEFKKFPPLPIEKGWAFPTDVAFKGERCSMPPEEILPDLPISRASYGKSLLALTLVVTSTFVFSCAIKCIISGPVKRFSMRFGCRYSRSMPVKLVEM